MFIYVKITLMEILVGVSGGVDSAVAAHILMSQGNTVHAAMMQIYSGDKFLQAGNSCYATDKTQEINDAKQNCERIGCDFTLIDVSPEFHSYVFNVFKNEYLNARTPNPCVLCNPLIKFNAFPSKAKMNGINFDKFATGHYVINEYNSKIGKFQLKRAIDTKKDQSYFLYALSQDTLKNVLFPLGKMHKDEVRNYAFRHNISVANKRDSQDFYSGSYSDLLDCNSAKGEIVDKFGNILGYHSGLHNYTIGQRKGILVSYSEALYVIGFDKDSNRLIVSTKDDTYSSGLIADNLSWVFWDGPKKSFFAKAKIRSSQTPFDCSVSIDNLNNARVLFNSPQSSVAPGQAVVFYDDDLVLGGGIIKAAL